MYCKFVCFWHNLWDKLILITQNYWYIHLPITKYTFIVLQHFNVQLYRVSVHGDTSITLYIKNLHNSKILWIAMKCQWL